MADSFSKTFELLFDDLEKNRPAVRSVDKEAKADLMRTAGLLDAFVSDQDVSSAACTVAEDESCFVVNMLCYELVTPDDSFSGILENAESVGFYYHDSEYFTLEIKLPVFWTLDL